MCQDDVLKFLEKEVKQNPEKWFTIEEVKLALKREKDQVGNVWRQINKLVAYGEIDNRLIAFKNCRFECQRVVRGKTE